MTKHSLGNGGRGSYGRVIRNVWLRTDLQMLSARRFLAAFGMLARYLMKILARRSLADFAGVEARVVPESDLTEWILRQPVTHEGVTHPRRTAHDELRDAATTETLDIDYESAWGPQADALVGAPPDVNTLWLTGSPDRAALLVRLDLAERLRRATRSLIVVEGSRRDIGDLAAGLASERTHLVAVIPEVPV